MQKKGIITIFPKSGDKKDLKNWRPISLLCVDYKIISKLLGRRIQLILEKVIDINQYCSIPGKSIINCNMLIRDIVFFVNEEEVEAAFFKIDRHKAFDLVNIEFLLKILKRMGFGDEFSSMIKMLYTNIESAMLINNNIGRYFSLTRSVRQGCPLSMILYVIYQEPLYCAIRQNVGIKPLVLPDHAEIKVIGYADDTNIIVKSEESLLEIDKTLDHFEKATNSKINKNNKSKLFGMGKWKNKTDWPIDWIVVDLDNFFTLGVFHCNAYADTLERNWSNITRKIENHIRILHGRKLTLFQRALYVNSCILSKVWYLAHIYPMSSDYVKCIQKSVFRYLWCGNYEPVKRKTVCLSLKEGGLGVFDCLTKANALLANTFLKSYVFEKGEQGFILYYCQRLLQKTVPRKTIYPMLYGRPSPYYDYTITLVCKCESLLKFPVLDNKVVYKKFLKKDALTVEVKYPLFNWETIWHNYYTGKIGTYQKEFLYKHLHDVLTVNKRLYTLRLVDSPLCNVCGEEESAVHIFYFCKKVKQVFIWF